MAKYSEGFHRDGAYLAKIYQQNCQLNLHIYIAEVDQKNLEKTEFTD